MARLATGDTAALGQLVERHQQRVLELAYRTVGNWAAAEDIAQEAFLRVWRSAVSYQPQAQFTTWLYRIVVNLCLDTVRRKRPSAGEEALGNVQAAAEPPAAEGAERSAAVHRAIADLPERQRIALVLYRFSEMSMQQVAEVTGWSASAVESLLVRAYAQLRVLLKDLI